MRLMINNSKFDAIVDSLGSVSCILYLEYNLYFFHLPHLCLPYHLYNFNFLFSFLCYFNLLLQYFFFRFIEVTAIQR